jgi:phosphatidylserine/phosphatidylglycerophosphate/cardiolipin synthase-like enzyme
MGILYDQQLLSFIMPCIREAQRYIFISTFKAQWTNNREGQRLALFWKTLLDKAEQNVKINVLLNYHANKARIAKSNIALVNKVKHQNIKFRYLANNRCIHAKIFLIDDQVATIGSHNLSNASHQRNFEATIAIHETEKIRALKDKITKLWLEAKELNQ